MSIKEVKISDEKMQIFLNNNKDVKEYIKTYNKLLVKLKEIDIPDNIYDNLNKIYTNMILYLMEIKVKFVIDEEKQVIKLRC
tara:strand:+ start:771 stop:1016 length:246 start_codon:yes stop_codon:yes gene_type:complete